MKAIIEKACRVFGVTKLFPEQEKALKAFIDKSDVFAKSANGVWKAISVPDDSARSRGAFNL